MFGTCRRTEGDTIKPRGSGDVLNEVLEIYKDF
jgi:hypothetical protein